MKKILLTIFVITILISNGLSTSSPVFGLESQNEPPQFNYAPDRKVDIDELALDVTPDFEKRTIKGSMQMNFCPVGKPLKELKLNAIDLRIEKVESTMPLAGHQVLEKEIVFTFKDPVAVGAKCELKVFYNAKPEKGLYFRVPSNGYDASEPHMFTQGEMIEARHWFPCYDYPNSKFKSKVTCHVPDQMTVLSNGFKVSSKKDDNGLNAITWKQDKPHVNYLISLVVGRFSELKDKSYRVPLYFYYLPSGEPYAQRAFAPTRMAIEFFEKETGVDYPWGRYGQVVVKNFTHTGMENTSLSTLSETAYTADSTENLLTHGGMYRFDWMNYLSEPLMSHELAHQWFGNLVTCKDWSHTWLNEGFATYYSLLFAAHKNGREDMLYGLHQCKEDIFIRDNASKPIVYRDYKKPGDQFASHLAYEKGAWVLHMLRSQLGEDLFRKCVKLYLERNQFKSVVTEDFNRVLEEQTGRSFDRFFDQWVYKPGLPELNIAYSYDATNKLAKITVSQKLYKPAWAKNQRRWKKNHPFHGQVKSKNSTSLKAAKIYQLPLKLRFKSGNKVEEKTVLVNKKTEDFYIPRDQAPDIVRIDPELSVLAKINFNPPPEMLYKQLEDNTDPIGRLTAAVNLEQKDDDTSIKNLTKCLNSDSFFGARITAARSLRKIHSPEAYKALQNSLQQEDARVRNAVLDALTYFYNDKTADILLKSVETEKNPVVISTALKGLGPYHQPRIKEALEKFLNQKSFKNMVAIAACKAIRAQDDPKYIEPLKEALKARNADFARYGFSTAISALAYICRNEKQKDDVREYLVQFLNSKKRADIIAAIGALGQLEDPKSISLLKTFQGAKKDSPERMAANSAIYKLRSVNKTHDNLSDLREEILELKEEQKKLKKEIKKLKEENKMKAMSRKKEPGKPKSHSKKKSRKRKSK